MNASSHPGKPSPSMLLPRQGGGMDNMFVGMNPWGRTAPLFLDLYDMASEFFQDMTFFLLQGY